MSPPPSGEPTIQNLLPRRTVPQDTVRVVGTAFGATPNGSAVLFPSLVGDAEAMLVFWSDQEIRALVPAAAIDGPVRVRIDGEETNGIHFSIADSLISLQEDLVPLFTTFTCIICHATTAPGGEFRIANSNLEIDYPAMFTTGTNPPNVIPRQSSASKMVQRLLPSAGALRMPQDQFPRYLNDAEILQVSDWIDQGARNN
jgi:hypothetical protein